MSGLFKPRLDITILQRAEAKDYRDIAAMINAGASLVTGLAARALFGTSFRPSESLKALVYFQDGDLPALSQIEITEGPGRFATYLDERRIPWRLIKIDEGEEAMSHRNDTRTDHDVVHGLGKGSGIVGAARAVGANAGTDACQRRGKRRRGSSASRMRIARG